MKNPDKKIKPDWTPDNAGDEFAVSIVPGVNKVIEKKLDTASPKRKNLSAKDYIDGILSGDLTIVSRAITLIESNSSFHIDLAQEVLMNIIPHSGNSTRVGITGVPGAGKSTFIEALGISLLEQGRKIAVLAVDPSSSLTKGSILGDKTRMEKLSRMKDCFIRPSPSGGTLGGVNRKTRETILVCEASGYDTIIIETVGVGQNEITVRSMVDFFLLLTITGAGDELQSMKKGVFEISDAVLVNKADGDNKIRAESFKVELNRALHYLSPYTEGWITKAFTASSINNKGINEIWNVVSDYMNYVKQKGIFEKRRNEQLLVWMRSMIEEELHRKFYEHPEIVNKIKLYQNEIIKGKITVTSAVQSLMEIYNDKEH